MEQVRSLQLFSKKPIRILLALTGLFLLPCLVMLFVPNQVISGGDVYTFEEGSSQPDTVAYQGISLRPGLYQVVLHYQGDCEKTEPLAHSTLRDGTVYTGGLLTNGEHLHKGLNATDYPMWLFESTKNLEILVSYDGVGSLQLNGYEFRETNGLWTMFITVILFTGGVLFIGFLVYYYDKAYPISLQKKKVVFSILVFTSIACLPYFRDDNYTGIDLTYHLHRIEGLKTGILTGQIPVRIEPEWLFGHGYAAGVFYCNSLLLFPAILRILGFTTLFSYNCFCIVLTLVTAVIAYQCFGRMFSDSDVGIVCSGLYTLSTFRLYKLFNTCAVGEASAVMFLPLILYGMFRVFTEDTNTKKYKTAWVPIAFGYAGLMQSHVLTCEITAFLTILICIVCLHKVLRKNTFLELAKGALGAVGLSLWYLVPFLDYYLTLDVHVKNLSARTIQRTGLTLGHLAFQFFGEGEYTPNGATGVYKTYPVGVGFVLLLGFLVFLALWFTKEVEKENSKIRLLGKTSACLGGLLLWMSTCYFPWDLISSLGKLPASLVSSLEFTHRVLGWGNVFLVTVAGFCILYAKHRAGFVYPIALVVTLGCLLVSSVLHMEVYLENGNFYRIYHEEGMGFGFISDGEYLIQGTDPGQLYYTGPKISENVELSAYSKGHLTAEFVCKNTGTEEGYVDLPLLLYKGYQAVSKDLGEKLKVTCGKNNVVRVLLPGGFEGQVKVAFVSPVYWRISEIISLLVSAFFVVLWYQKNRRAKGC